MKILVPVKQVARLREGFALTDGGALAADSLERAPNAWDAFSLEAALALRDDAPASHPDGGERHQIVLVTVGVVVFPGGDLPVAVRLQGGVELRGLQTRQRDPPRGVGLPDGLADRALRVRPGCGFGSGFELDRGAQLGDRGDRGHLGVVLIGAVGGPLGDDPDLIQRQPALP